MFSRKKEKKVQKLIKEHFKAVSQTVKSMEDTIESYLKEDIGEPGEFAYKTHEFESNADSLRREIIETLYKGAFFPSIREDLVNFVARQDNIADAAESCCDFIISQHPEVPDKYTEDILKLARASYETLPPLEKAVTHYFNDYKEVKKYIKEVNTKEEDADTMEWHLTEEIFKSKDISLAEKMHINEFIFHIVHISDIIEDAADMLDSVIIKKSI
ncbi:MAG: TIGR00153 family protein [Elusimicrobiota bacterium]